MSFSYRRIVKGFRTFFGGDRLWIRALRHGVAPGLEHVCLLNLMQPKTVVDIGANRGQFALAIRHALPEARIVSFEPLRCPAAKFLSVFNGDTRVLLHESAIGPEAGEATIHVSKCDDSSSLLAIGTEQRRLFPGTEETHTLSIRVGLLRDFIAADEIVSPALLKLDVQGYELSALQGCENLLPRFDWVYAECSFVELYEGQALASEVIAWLSERGFALTGMYNMSYDQNGLAVQADFLFTRKSTERV